MSTFNILSIDGGGLRGIIPLRILQKVEEITNKKIHQCFDMISGTSTGGIIACCLTLRKQPGDSTPKYSVDDIAELYVKYGSTIFPGKSSVGKFIGNMTNLYSPRFSDSGLDRVLREYLKDERIKDSLLPILVSTYDLDTNSPVFFKTREAKISPSANALIYDI